MIYARRIAFVRDMEYGDGWKVKRIAAFQPTESAAALTHDLLEHGPYDHGTYAEELEAYGAMLVYRLDSPYLYPDTQTRADKLHALGVELGSSILFGAYARKPPEYFTQLPKKIKPITEELYANLKLMSDAAVTTLAEEIQSDLHEEQVSQLKSWVIHWAALGHLRATNFVNKSTFPAVYIWQVTLDAITDFLRVNASYCTEASVHVDLTRCSAIVIPRNETFN